MKTCSTCHGKGEIVEMAQVISDQRPIIPKPCPACSSTKPKPAKDSLDPDVRWLLETGLQTGCMSNSPTWQERARAVLGHHEPKAPLRPGLRPGDRVADTRTGDQGELVDLVIDGLVWAFVRWDGSSRVVSVDPDILGPARAAHGGQETK